MRKRPMVPTRGTRRRSAVAAVGFGLLAVALCLVQPGLAVAQEGEEAGGGQDRMTQALDSTASQWSFQFAYQSNAEYYQDILENGYPRPKGNQDFLQLRIIAPFTKKQTGWITLLPRLTVRYSQNQANEWGFSTTELFVLGIVQDWGVGRWGVGPLVNIPGDKKVGSDKWGYGLAGALVNGGGNWFYGVLFTEYWQDTSGAPEGTSSATPLGIAVFLNYKLPGGWYVSNGDMVAQYDWNSETFYLPGAIRVGKIIVGETSSWNLYAEYRTSLIYEDWPGPAVEHGYRINLTYTIPVN